MIEPCRQFFVQFFPAENNILAKKTDNELFHIHEINAELVSELQMAAGQSEIWQNS